jgi:hypothetical protein
MGGQDRSRGNKLNVRTGKQDRDDHPTSDIEVYSHIATGLAHADSNA